MAREADRSIGLIMPFSSAQMKALCLQAQPWTLHITLKSFCGCTGCVQCCGWGLYNLVALGNYKDKWREAQSITHPVTERILRRGNFVFSKAAPTCPYPPTLPNFSLSPPLACLFFAVFFSICFWPIPLPPSLHLPLLACLPPHPLLLM